MYKKNTEIKADKPTHKYTHRQTPFPPYLWGLPTLLPGLISGHCAFSPHGSRLWEPGLREKQKLFCCSPSFPSPGDKNVAWQEFRPQRSSKKTKIETSAASVHLPGTQRATYHYDEQSHRNTLNSSFPGAQTKGLPMFQITIHSFIHWKVRSLESQRWCDLDGVKLSW